jgi:hypothetical protein
VCVQQSRPLATKYQICTESIVEARGINVADMD